MYQLCLLFMQFLLFSILGYVVEIAMCAIVDHKITNRGFLCGPVIPIYGVGSLALLWLLKPFQENLILIFLLGMVVTTVIEYVTSYLLERIFHNKWWDYSAQKYNINGRICLMNSVLFGVGSVIIIYFAGPWILQFLLQLKDQYLITFSIVLFFLFLFDVIYSCVVAYSLRNRLIIVENLKNEKLAKIPGLLEQILSKRLEGLKGWKKYPSRLLKAFPTLGKTNQKEFELMKKLDLKEKEKRKKSKTKQKKTKKIKKQKKKK